MSETGKLCAKAQEVLNRDPTETLIDMEDPEYASLELERFMTKDGKVYFEIDKKFCQGKIGKKLCPNANL